MASATPPAELVETLLGWLADVENVSGPLIAASFPGKHTAPTDRLLLYAIALRDSQPLAAVGQNDR